MITRRRFVGSLVATAGGVLVPRWANAATESLYVDGETFSLTASTGAYTDVDDDPDSPDGNWVTADADDSSTQLVASFPTPTGTLDLTTNAQTFKAWVRRSSTGGNDPTCQARLWENSINRATLANLNITSDTGVLLTWNWSATSLANSDGSGVEIVLECSPSGGGPSTRRSGDVGAIEWIASYTEASTRRVIVL